MEISVPSILLGLGGKSLLNWTLVLLQKKHMFWSFLGVFSCSLALVDSLLTLSLSVLHLQGDICVLGVRFTRHHVCLLVQIFSYTYDALNWPVLIASALDHFWILLPGPTTASRGLKLCYITATCLLWSLVLLYVFLVSGFRPVFGNEPHHHLLHQCWVLSSTQMPQVSMVLFLTIVCAVLHVLTGLPMPKNRASKETKTDAKSKKDTIGRCLWIFLSTWVCFIVLLAVILMLPDGIPAYLGLNVAWLCFTRSFIIGVFVCTRWSTPQLEECSAFSDYFCNWRLSFLADQENP
ncbi:probable G-protein coupled receptor 160 [Hypomesus transpacificus]|uniref:probable G-protein coupled receptor 160 n=1 Tax=Hypomesus transpacificus TaxID=137520 RepID=UPI001F07B528|nr:probable G-protein coupled receptor 160 [Hypomesus transpacificus]XP_046884477.1 probable G-protein coupled receptor 160 [Hypomesus transpacificus]XP_046884478.1 probable G-protein coupled receptor 160 [Hypomesus transpacificus]XP_046884479.1 probable G-protein coupled receptor 160 [Hypomesus transpacificus]XP_046884480.1 probable G-protein coupled receptor 160 [Hypomesus transpacificus]XP_046884481.1 probable G-protein coupled receptor 160 [Hypomesus transpacificus]XP_046884482.1 probable